MTNPVLVVEVTSNSTEDYDRGAKLAQYQSIAALQSVVIVSHRARRLTVITRSPDGWKLAEFEQGTIVTLVNPALSLSVSEIYAVLSSLG